MFLQFFFRMCIILFIFVYFIHICTGAACDDPPIVDNADVNLQGSNFTIGTTAYYTCQENYLLNASVDPLALCISEEGDQRWQLEPFSCIPTCSGLPTIPYATFKVENNNVTYKLGDSVKFICQDGYTIGTNVDEILCGMSKGNVSWIIPIEPCRPKSCGYPGDIENSVRHGNLFTFPNNVTYVCNEGFQLKGAATIFCLPTGRWSLKVPTCEAVVCPILPHPENGKVNSNDRLYGSHVSYKCDDKYQLHGNAQRVCQADASWSGSPPICVEILCYLSAFENLDSIIIRPKKNTYKVGEIAILQCIDGDHIKTTKCGPSGTWSVMAATLPCKKKQDKISTTELPLIKTTSGKLINPDKSSRENCEDPGDIKNGKRKFNGTTPNSILMYSCEDGFELRGQGTLICSPNGKWNIEKLPICVKPIPVSTIVGVVIGIILLILLGIGIFFYVRYKGKNKFQGFGKQSKALTTDATNLEEIARLEKGKKPIPVTVL